MAFLYNNDPKIQEKLNRFKKESDTIVKNSSSNLVKKAFKNRWLHFNRTIEASIASEAMHINISNIKSEVFQWVKEMDSYREIQIEDHNKDDFKEAMPVRQKHQETLNDIDTVIYQLNQLKNDIDDVENQFSTSTTRYRSPIRQAMNDRIILHNEIKGIQGALSGYKNVSVYLHY